MKKTPPNITEKIKKVDKKTSVKRPPFLVILLGAIIVFSPFYINSEKRQKVTAQYAATSMLPLEKKEDIEITIEDKNLSFVEVIPDGRKNGRCKQPTIDRLHAIGQNGKYRIMVRMNGDGKDSGGVSLHVQDSILRMYGMRLIFVNAHRKNSPENIHQILAEYDGVIVHCLHGFDRTGGIVGYHLRKEGLTISEVIKHNKWEGYLDKKGCDYLPYFKMIL